MRVDKLGTECEHTGGGGKEGGKGRTEGGSLSEAVGRRSGLDVPTGGLLVWLDGMVNLIICWLASVPEGQPGFPETS